MAIEKILVVDDEEIVRLFVEETLSRSGYEVERAARGKEGLRLIEKNSYDIVFTDMKMPDISGIELIREGKELSPKTLFVVMTGFGTVENAVEAMREGAFDYLVKPFTPDTIEAIVEKASQHSSLVEENNYLREQVNRGASSSEKPYIAESAAMKKIFREIETVAKSQANVFITGESGTGKEVVASAIHNLSPRKAHPFIKVNCAAIPETLVESEFFGHEKGSFTGANSKRLGRFELADSGTLLLDEITEVPLLLQAKLLRAIQEKEFERIGGSKPVVVDVRIISTSNRDIGAAIEEKHLREDLYYRLNVVPITIPPLRERKDDILPLARFFVEKFSVESHLPRKELSTDACEKLMHYHWPGNVRELANIIERAVVMSPTEKIKKEQIYIETANSREIPASNSKSPIKWPHLVPGMTLKELEKRLIIETLEAENQNRTRTAEILDISVRTLRNKLKEYMK